MKTSGSISKVELVKLGHPNKFEQKELALKIALDTRKFEIELYWKRATYFWAFLASITATYAGVAIADFSAPKKSILLLLISCVGLIFAIAWYFVNKGSKYWQENWEYHVSTLQKDIVGDLFTKFDERKSNDIWLKNLIAGKKRYSVSKINIVLSFYVCILWMAAVILSAFPTVLQFVIDSNFENLKALMLICTFVGVISLYLLGLPSTKERKGNDNEF